MEKENIIQRKSYSFALKIIKLHQFLYNEKNEYTISRQLLKSATSIGANIEEAIGAQSKKDFISKLSIAYKEARESHYWIRLLTDSKYIQKENSVLLVNDIIEILKIIASILKTMKMNQRKA